MTLLKELDEAGSTGLDMSPGDALARRAAAFIRDQALNRDAVLEEAAKVCDKGAKSGRESPRQPEGLHAAGALAVAAYLIRALKREPSAGASDE